MEKEHMTHVGRSVRAAILTFHNTPNYGATLQCFALSSYLRSQGADVEIINYMPPHALRQYAKSLFLGRRRALGNVVRILRFLEFVRRHLTMSGAPIFRPAGLEVLREKHYEVAFTGSDEVWKVDHMRTFDPSYYLSFLDSTETRLVAYAATSSTVTDLRKYAEPVRRLLQRFSALGIRDRSTWAMVRDLMGSDPVEVLDPTLIWDFSSYPLSPVRQRPYIALYSWLDQAGMASVRLFAKRHGLEVVCVGCRHPEADANFIDIGPEEWLRLIKHASFVVTDFFHGVLFALIFQRPFYAHVDEKKKMKLQQALSWVGLPHHLYADVAALADMDMDMLQPEWREVETRLQPLRDASRRFIDEQLEVVRASSHIKE